jgi:hypothetical protein
MINDSLKGRKALIFVEYDADEATKSEGVNSKSAQLAQSRMFSQRNDHKEHVCDVARVEHKNQGSVKVLKPCVYQQQSQAGCAHEKFKGSRVDSPDFAET